MENSTGRRYRRGSFRTRASALVITMFTVAAMLTLGTTFIAICRSESTQSRGDKNSQLARSVAMVGFNWAASYMSLSPIWRNHPFPPPPKPETVYLLQPTDSLDSGSSSSHKVAWAGRTLTYQAFSAKGNPPVPDIATSPSDPQTFFWRLRVDPQATDTGAVVPLGIDPSSTLHGVFDILIERLSPNLPNGNFPPSQPVQYAVTSTGYVYNGNVVYAQDTQDGTLMPRPAAAVAIRSVTTRIRPQNPLDFALFEENMRSWNVPGFNTQYGTNTMLDNGLQNLAKSSEEYQLLTDYFKSAQNDSVGIPPKYTMSGNFVVDGLTPYKDPTAIDPFAFMNGTIHVYADSSNIGTIKFTGSQTGFANGGTNPNGGNNKYDGDLDKTDPQTIALRNKIFQGAHAPNFSAAPRGLPPVAGYMTTWVGDTSNWTWSQSNLQDGYSQVVSAASPAPTAKGLAELATNDASGNHGPGYVKVATPSGGPSPVPSSVPPSLQYGSDVEIQVDSSGQPVNHQQPGFARVQITFTNDNNIPKANIQKVGAYSGKPVPFLSDNQTSHTLNLQSENPVIYVDGGNVEVSGKVPASVTIVAAASSDRPTTMSAVRGGDPVIGAPPILIRPDQQMNIPNTIYKDPAGAKNNLKHDMFEPDQTTGRLTKIPDQDSTGRWYFPAYDPTKVGTQASKYTIDDKGNQIWSNDVTAVLYDAALTREGNVSITGNLTKTKDAAIGIVAQNYVLLNDQSTSQTLHVDGAVMSMQRSVQYAGFMTSDKKATTITTTTEDHPYWQSPYFFAMSGVSIPGKGPLYGNEVTNGTFKYAGSIIGQYADVEGTTSNSKSLGYTIQNIGQDPTLSNNLPPIFPNFSRAQSQGPIIWVVVAVNDSASLKAGTQ